MRLLATLTVSLFGLTACATPTPKAEIDRLKFAWAGCTLRTTTKLDDGRENAENVARAVRETCKIQALEYADAVSTGKHPAYRDGARRGVMRLDYYVRFVLDHRASKRKRGG